MKNQFYTGVGSRNTPVEIQHFMTQIAFKLKSMDWTLRSGAAKGADTAFEMGAGTQKQIFLKEQATAQAMTIAENFHPAWNRCSDFAKRLHGRNAFQVLGIDLKTPSKFLLCWTPDACISHEQRTIRTGGTGTAISIAEFFGVKVFNLAIEFHRKRLETMCIGLNHFYQEEQEKTL